MIDQRGRELDTATWDVHNIYTACVCVLDCEQCDERKAPHTYSAGGKGVGVHGLRDEAGVLEVGPGRGGVALRLAVCGGW